MDIPGFWISFSTNNAQANNRTRTVSMEATILALITTNAMNNSGILNIKTVTDIYFPWQQKEDAAGGKCLQCVDRSIFDVWRNQFDSFTKISKQTKFIPYIWKKLRYDFGLAAEHLTASLPKTVQYFSLPTSGRNIAYIWTVLNGKNVIPNKRF